MDCSYTLIRLTPNLGKLDNGISNVFICMKTKAYLYAVGIPLMSEIGKADLVPFHFSTKLVLVTK